MGRAGPVVGCLGLRGAPQARLQTVLAATPAEGCDSDPSVGAACLAGVFQRVQLGAEGMQG